MLVAGVGGEGITRKSGFIKGVDDVKWALLRVSKACVSSNAG